MTTAPRSADGPRRKRSDGSRLLVQFRLVAFALVTTGLVVLSIALAVPFLPALTWGVALAIIAWPMQRWLARFIENPPLRAGLTTTIVVALILIPGLFVAYHLARETAAAAEKAQHDGVSGGIRAFLERVPGGAGALAWVDRLGIDVEGESRRLVQGYTANIADLTRGSIAAVIQFLLTIFILYNVLLERREFLHGLRDLLPMTRAETDRVVAYAADSVKANLYANLLTSVIDTVGSGLLFFWFGLPSPILWSSVMFVLSVLPIAGAALVWFPTAVYLALSNRLAPAAALLTWGCVSFILVDNLLYARVSGRGMRLNQVVALVSILGGIALFGISGLILGPAIIAVTLGVLEVWKERLAERA
jgi:predicted PurR-regulated permease PerM